MNNTTRVALIFGGASPEHGVSCLTAASVLGAIDRSRFDVVGVGITPEGRWCQVPLDVVANYRVVDGQVPHVADPEHEAVWMVGEAGCEVATRQGDRLVDVNGIDIAFALLHGPFGEDGTIQGLFEMMGIRYVGSGVTSSAVGMDKHFMKVAFESAGLPVWPYEVITDHQWRADRQAALARAAHLSYPIFVKPCRGGSSLGITKVDRPEDVEAAVEHARRFDPKVILEQGFVGARELECAVLADPDVEQGCRTSPVGEIRILEEGGFYDFDAKYIAEDHAALDVPAQISDDVSDRIRAVAAQAFNAIDAEGLARVDVFVTPEDEIFVNEINTMPGFTEISMYPKLWQHSGISYPELVARLIDLATQRDIGLR